MNLLRLVGVYDKYAVLFRLLSRAGSLLQGIAFQLTKLDQL